MPAGEQRVRAEVDEYQGLLRRPELVLDWEDTGEQHERYFSLKSKGPQWYMLSQLRDDLRENRLVRS